MLHCPEATSRGQTLRARFAECKASPLPHEGEGREEILVLRKMVSLLALSGADVVHWMWAGVVCCMWLPWKLRCSFSLQ